MTDHEMRRWIPVFVAGAALIAAACSEPAAPPQPVAEKWVPIVGPNITAKPANMWAIEQAGTFVFTIDPAGGEAKIGVYTLNYDANVVCDPETSGYGPSVWRNSCNTLNEPITITAKFWVEDGHTYADFSPDVRFDPSKYVWVSAVAPGLRGKEINEALRDQYSVNYTRVVDGMRYFINEAANNPDLATIFGEEDGLATGALKRRLLHFSGYYVRSGRTCDLEGVCADGSLDLDAMD